jgi:hypothetical protein
MDLEANSTIGSLGLPNVSGLVGSMRMVIDLISPQHTAHHITRFQMTNFRRNTCNGESGEMASLNTLRDCRHCVMCSIVTLHKYR